MTELRIFNSNVKSVLLYACEPWRITKALTHKVQTFIKRFLRAILHIKWQDKITKQRNLEKNRTSTSRSPDQEKKVGLAGPHPVKTNIQRGTLCSKMEPTREMEEKKTPLHLEKVCGD